MSYCRWSTVLPDNYESDLYIYDHVGGYISVNIAGQRTRGIENAPRVHELTHKSPEDFIESLAARARWREQHADTLKPVPIDLPYAGETREFEDPVECIAFLQELKALGYRMPDHVLHVDTYEVIQ